MTVAEIEHGMGAAEYQNWWRYYSEEPFGPMRDNLHAGIVASAVINSRQGRKRGAASVSASDFLLRTEREQRQTETQRSLAFLRTIGRRKVNADG